MIRFGLCCVFKSQPITFRRKTARFLAKFSRDEQLSQLSKVCLDNARALLSALEFCRNNAIGAFRINSQILPLKTHPQVGYDIKALPDGVEIMETFQTCGQFSVEQDVRTTFHPDQFIVLSSPDPDVVERSVADLQYQAEVSEWVNADVINIHAGGVYGNKKAALDRLIHVIDSLPEPVKTRLTLENDDRSYTPQDLLPVCEKTGIPLVYDIHHHRCLPDALSEKAAWEKSLDTWNREPLFHISSPKDGWSDNLESGYNPRKHHDYIDINDFPRAWLAMNLTVEVEAKAKELAIVKLLEDIKSL
jgi:UV DNA damage endonuclease